MGFLTHIPSLEILQKKIKINSHIPLEKNGNIHGLTFLDSPKSWYYVQFPHIQVLRKPLIISY